MKRKSPPPNDALPPGFLRGAFMDWSKVEDRSAYPYSIPALSKLDELTFHPKVTFLVGENGSGKSTLIEAVAVAARFNAEGGSKATRFETARSESDLHKHLRLVRNSERERDGFFLRAESFFNVATMIDALGIDLRSYGGKSLHAQSHGESFLALVENRFGEDGLYLLDEPEAALSPQRQLTLLVLIDELVQRARCQFIIATHSPILMAYPDATILEFSPTGVQTIAYQDTEHFQVTRTFLASPERFFRNLFKRD
jgi:predicted ATPase